MTCESDFKFSHKMAESSRVGSYRCKFIDDVPELLICGLCKHAANGPSIATCCGELFCKACIASALDEKKPCPSCEEPTFSTFFNRKYERSIKNLRVHCTMKDRGCQWTGQLEQLDVHLEVKTGNCEYVDVNCPKNCGQQIQKCQLAIHIANECPNRDFDCMYCGFKATYAIISNKHWPECQNYPVPCPNKCTIGAVEHSTLEVKRNMLEDHLNTCPLQVVECDFSYAGCNKKLQRQDMEKHMEESTQEHLTLMAAASVRMSREFEKKLREQRDEFRGYVEQKEKETAEQFKQKDKEIKRFQESFRETQKALQVANEKLQQLQVQIVDVRNQMERRDKETQKKLEQQIQVLTEQLQQKNKEIQNLQQADERLRENLQQNERESKEKEKQLREQLQVKHEQAKQQTIAVEEQLKTESKEFQEKLKECEEQTQQVNQKLESEIQQIERRMYDCENYNFPLVRVKLEDKSQYMYTHSGGYKFRFVISGQGLHVSVKLEAHSGPFDGSLRWPAKCTITLRLINQHRDQDHVTVTKELEWEEPRVEGLDIPALGYRKADGKARKRNKPVSILISDKFIACNELWWNAERQTQYIKNDYLHFKVTGI